MNIQKAFKIFSRAIKQNRTGLKTVKDTQDLIKPRVQTAEDTISDNVDLIADLTSRVEALENA
jgi:hypothetical protein